MPIFNISKRKKKKKLNYPFLGLHKGHDCTRKKNGKEKGNMLRLYVFSLLFQNDVVSCKWKINK